MMASAGLEGMVVLRLLIQEESKSDWMVDGVGGSEVSMVEESMGCVVVWRVACWVFLW